MKNSYLFFENNPYKITHQKDYLIKRYTDHLKEIEDIGNYLLNFYNLENYKDIFNRITKYHDVGKLLNWWKINEKIKPPHAIFSTLYYNAIAKKENYPTDLKYIIAFLSIDTTPLYIFRTK